MFRLKSTVLAMALVAAVALGSAANAAERKISIVMAGGQNTMFAPLLVAIGGGLFEKRGIEVEQQPFGSGTRASAAFNGGSGEFCICGPTNILSAVAGGIDTVAIFNQYLGGTVVFMAPKAMEKTKGTDLKNFDGVTWAYTAEGSVSQAFMIRAAQAAGLDWSKQRGIAIGGIAAFVPTLKEGRAELVTMDPMSGAKAMSLGIGYPVFNTNDPTVVEPIWGQQIGMTLATTQAFIDKNEQLVQDVVDAVREGQVFVKKNINNPDAIFAKMPAEYREANPDFAEQWKFVKVAYVVDGTFTNKAVADTVSFALAVGTLKPFTTDKLDPRKIFSNRFAAAAVAKMPGK